MCKAKSIHGSAFLPFIFKLCDWKSECRYKIEGIRRSIGEAPILVFDLNDATAFLPNPDENVESIQQNRMTLYPGLPMLASKRFIGAFPAQWSDGYGKLFYRHAQVYELNYFNENGKWPLEEAQYETTEISPSPEADIKKNIAELMDQMSRNGGDNGPETYENDC